MKRQAFKAFLVEAYRGVNSGAPLSPTSAHNYAAYASAIERVLDVDLDDLKLDQEGLVVQISRLVAVAASGVLSGKQVSNFSSALRAYAQFRAVGGEGPSVPSGASPSQRPPTPAPGPKRQGVAPRPADPLISHMSVKGLLAMHGAIIDELCAREIVRTSNAPGGDYAETLFARAFGWTLANSSALGYDAEGADGLRYQIKSRRLTVANGSRQLSALRRLPAKGFDVLAAVLFDQSYEVQRAILLPHHLIEPLARFRPHTNSWTFMLEERVWDLPLARDVTGELRRAALEL